MNNIYKEATRGYDVTAATAARTRGLIRDAQGLKITFSGPKALVEVPAQPPHGACKVLGQFNGLLET